jgi:hypothetical protein
MIDTTLRFVNTRPFSPQRFHNMAPTSTRKDLGRKLPPPYLSPPEETAYPTFSQGVTPSPTQPTWPRKKLPPIQDPRSPPASPSASTHIQLAPISTDLSQASAARDPPLFSHSQSDNHAAPLFDDAERSPRDSLQPVESNTLLEEESEPKPIFRRLLTNFDGPHPALEYWRASMEEMSRIPGFGSKKAIALHPPVTNTRLDDYTARIKHKLNHPSKAGITKTPRHPQLKPMASKPAKVAALPTPRKAPRAVAGHRDPKSQSVEPQARKRAPPSKHAPLKAEDKDWAKLEDFSPPTSTLDKAGAKPLKVAWKGSPNDLRADPEVQHMHPQEVETAAELKLFGAQYLANKRRIFIAKVECLRQGKNFTKTAAQQACNIDVNKTSKLWEAYDKSGWFDREHFEKFL